ncbi:unnamed protein product [Scytosiphon promiscuus]
MIVLKTSPRGSRRYGRSFHRSLLLCSAGLPVTAARTSSSARRLSSPSFAVEASSLPNWGSRNSVERGRRERSLIFQRQAPRSGGHTGDTEEATAGSGPSLLERRGKARVTVRRARERDYQGVADIRGVIIPVGMSGATGFLGGTVVIDDPAEAERRMLMAKVADLVSGEAVALIALEGKRIVGTVDCILQSAAAAVKTPRQQRQQSDNVGRGRGATMQVFLKNLFVLPDARRRGIARELVKGAEVFARKEKAGIVCLEVARKNTAARELYDSCGFEEIERPGPVEGGMGGVLLKSLGMGKRYMVKRI